MISLEMVALRVMVWGLGADLWITLILHPHPQDTIRIHINKSKTKEC
jgi:hypothetical protein